MQTDHSKAISGLSIAVIIISALTLACCIIGWIFVTMGGSVFNQVAPSAIDDAIRDYGSGHYHREYGDLSTSDIMALGNLGIMVGGAALIWEAAMCVVSLIAGVLGMKNARNRGKLGAVFGWSLAAAICSLLSGRMVTMVLLIIMTVFAYKDKNAPAWQPQPYYGQAPQAQQPYGQPMAQPMQQPYGQPVAAPAQPYGQPGAAAPAPAPQPPMAPMPAPAPQPQAAPMPSAAPQAAPAPADAPQAAPTATPQAIAPEAQAADSPAQTDTDKPTQPDTPSDRA